MREMLITQARNIPRFLPRCRFSMTLVLGLKLGCCETFGSSISFMLEIEKGVQ